MIIFLSNIRTNFEYPRMTEAIRINPKTGLKVFNTRAAKLTAKINGKGYSEIEDEP